MIFSINLIRRQWLKRGMMLVLAAIASILLFATILLFGHTAQAQKPFTGKPAPKAAYLSRLVSLVDGDRDRLVTIFKDIHQNPELAFMETRQTIEGIGLRGENRHWQNWSRWHSAKWRWCQSHVSRRYGCQRGRRSDRATLRQPEAG